MEKVLVRLLKALYPYVEWDEVEMRVEIAERWKSEWYLVIVSNKGMTKPVANKMVQPLDAIVQIKDTTDDEDLQGDYMEKFGVKVPNRYKNDNERIKNKIYS